MPVDDFAPTPARDPRLLPGISAVAWGRAAFIVLVLAVVAIATLALVDPHASGAAWGATLVISAIVLIIPIVGSILRSRAEAEAGYYTIGTSINLDQLHPRTGELLRAAGSPPSSAQALDNREPPQRAVPQRDQSSTTAIAREQGVTHVALPTTSRGSPPWVPTGAGAVLEVHPRGWRQLALTVLVGLTASAAGGLSVLGHTQHRSVASFLVPFLIALAVMAAIWLLAVGLRTVRLRRLIRRFPGTLVFSFRRSDDVSEGLRRLGLIDQQFSFNEVGIQVVADLHGLTLWQGTPPQMYAALPWTLVVGIHLERDIYPSSNGDFATALRIEAGTPDRITQLSLFSVDASILPFPSRSEVEWVERQLDRLFRDSRDAGGSDPAV